MLPKLSQPLLSFKLPSNDKTFRFRPFLVKEEKVLVFAKAANNIRDIILAVKQVVNNAAVDDSFDIDKIAFFDLEFLFLKIYASSMRNVIKASYTRDNHNYEIEIKLDDLAVTETKHKKKPIKVSDKIAISFHYPECSLYEDKEFIDLGESATVFDLAVRCLDKIYEDETVHDVRNVPRQEVEEFIDSLPANVFEDIQEFFADAPHLSLKFNFKNEKGEKDEVELCSLTDFFFCL